MKYVKHIKKNEWGVGKVISVENHKIEIDFLNCGIKLLNSKIALLEEVLDEGEIGKFKENKLITSLNNKKNKKSTFVESISLEELTKIFHKSYPDGFYDIKYLELERSSKEKLSNDFKKHFSKENLSKKIKSKDYKELSEISKKLISATKIIHSIEKTTFRKSISIEKNQELFINILYKTLYDIDNLDEKSFYDYKEFFNEISCNKWTLITYFLNMIDPEKYAFLKPKMSKKAAEVFGFDLNYNMVPNWETYNSLLINSNKLMEGLKDLKPRDYIDIENFMQITIKNI